MFSCEQIKDDNSISHNEQQKLKNKGYKLIDEMIKKTGDYNQLLSKKDVVYTYSYKTPNGESDISTEKYIFDGELSYGLYNKHERTLSNLTGNIEQGYDGEEFWLKHEGKVITEENYIKKVSFNRPTNFYWFTMMQKLLDPGVLYEYVEEKTINQTKYDVVKITFESKDRKPKDIYQVYINRRTKLVDQFLFTVVDYGKTTPFLMEVEYELIEDLYLPTKRRYKNSNWEAEISDEPWTMVNCTNIKFDNNLKKKDFEL